MQRSRRITLTLGMGLARSLSLLMFLTLAAGCAKKELCAPGQQPVHKSAPRHPIRGYLPYMYAHDDMDHEHPLADSLAAGAYSIEADLWGPHLEVGSWPWQLKGTLQALYLEPLQQRVDALGSVYGDGLPFQLWIDVREPDPLYVDALRALLAQYPMLSLFQQSAVVQRPVTVVLTGDRFVKSQIGETPEPVPATRDGVYLPDAEPASPRFSHVTIYWPGSLGWDGSEPDDELLRQLGCAVENAHARGYTLRFEAPPEGPKIWELMLRYGVDFITTDRIAELSDYLSALPDS